MEDGKICPTEIILHFITTKSNDGAINFFICTFIVNFEWLPAAIYIHLNLESRIFYAVHAV